MSVLGTHNNDNCAVGFRGMHETNEALRVPPTLVTRSRRRRNNDRCSMNPSLRLSLVCVPMTQKSLADAPLVSLQGKRSPRRKSRELI